MGPDKWYPFQRVIHLSSIHLGRFDCNMEADVPWPINGRLMKTWLEIRQCRWRPFTVLRGRRSSDRSSTFTMPSSRRTHDCIVTTDELTLITVTTRMLRPDLHNIFRQSYEWLTIMPQLRLTYGGRLINKTSLRQWFWGLGVLGWQWHQLDHMQTVCTSLETDNHTRTSTLNFLQTRCSSWCPSNSVKALKANEQNKIHIKNTAA